jgi:hypothetical protein
MSTLTLLEMICNYNCGGLETSVYIHTKARVWSVVQESTKAQNRLPLKLGIFLFPLEMAM